MRHEEPVHSARTLRVALTADPELPVPPGLYGGIERIVDMLARGLLARGHEVTVFSHPDSQTAGNLVPWPGLTSRSMADTVRNAATLAGSVLAGRFDLVHSFSRVAYLTPILPLPIPKLMTYQRQITRRSVRLGHALSCGTLCFTAISRSIMQGVGDIGAWHLVYNGVPLATFKFRQYVEPGAPLVFLGRVEKIKGPHLAIEIARRSGLPLIIAGNVPPEHRDFFEAEIAPHIDGKNVTYAGPVDDAEKNALLGRARALLMPILWEEPFGIVMAEAMACGTPVIGFARGAVPEVVQDGVTGFVVDSLDELVEAVGHLRRIDRANCRARVERLFSDHAVVDNYVGIYDRILPTDSRRRTVIRPSPSGSRRVCILTPGQLSTNPRLVKEADALHGAGYDVSVIASDFVSWARDTDRSFGDRPWKVVRTLPFGPLAPRFPRAIQIIRQRLAYTIWRAGIRNAAIARAAWHPIGPDLVRAALATQADLYIAHYPAALPAAAIAAQHHQASYAYDAEDFHLGDYPDEPKYETERRLIHAIEDRYLSGCVYVTAASPGIADAYADAYGIPRPTVVLNVFPLTQRAFAPTPQGTAMPAPSVYWFSQTIGPDRGLECAVRAIGLAHTRPHLYLRGTPAVGFIDRLRIIADEVGAGERLHFLPPGAPSEMVRLATIYDLGLSGEPGPAVNNQIALGNKLFTYLLAGIPVVMSNIPAHRAIDSALGEAARVYPVDNPVALAAAFDALLNDPVSLAKAREAAWRLGQTRFNWENEQAVLQGLVCRVWGSDVYAAEQPALSIASPGCAG